MSRLQFAVSDHPQDIQIAEKFLAFQELREEFLLKRRWLRSILSLYVGKQAFNDFLFTSRGKPYLSDSSWHFNLSHSGTFLMLGISKALPLGVDIEKVQSGFDFDAMSDIIMSQKELEKLIMLKGDEGVNYFFDLWVQKEAYGKLLGVGFTEDPREWEIDSLEKSLTLFRGDDFRAAIAYPNGCEPHIEYFTL